MNRRPRRPVLPPHEAVTVYGRGKALAVRQLYVARCNLAEIMQSLDVTGEFVSQALRVKGHTQIWPH